MRKRAQLAYTSLMEDFEADVRKKIDVSDCPSATPTPSPVPGSRPNMKLPPKDVPDLPHMLWKYSEHKAYLSIADIFYRYFSI